jgi:Protein of unknown function (DUF2637)
VVLAVAAFAAVVSFSHIHDLGRAHGQSGTAARLLPLSADRLILAASLVLLHEAHNGRPVPALARGEVSGIRRIRKEMHLGQPRAHQVREHLTALAPETADSSGRG